MTVKTVRRCEYMGLRDSNSIRQSHMILKYQQVRTSPPGGGESWPIMVRQGMSRIQKLEGEMEQL
jgi:hypothetical protein